MKRWLTHTAALAALAWLGLVPLVRAQEKPRAQAPPPAPECCSSCGPCEKVAHPTIEKVPHTRYCYDVKEEHYCYPKGVHSPILTIFCHDHCGKCEGCQDQADPCHNCGQPRTRKVLIKEFVTEEIPTPKCQVERVGECTPRPACSPGPCHLEEGVLPQNPAPAAVRKTE
jgi:hypothetical protein